MLLQRLKGKRSVDALDRVADADVEMVEQAQVTPRTNLPPKPTTTDLTAILTERITTKLHGRYQAIARLAFLEKHTIGIISRRTGLSKRWLKQHLTIISRLLSGK